MKVLLRPRIYALWDDPPSSETFSLSRGRLIRSVAYPPGALSRLGLDSFVPTA
jgi:hypothetical protein